MITPWSPKVQVSYRYWVLYAKTYTLVVTWGADLRIEGKVEKDPRTVLELSTFGLTAQRMRNITVSTVGTALALGRYGTCLGCN